MAKLYFRYGAMDSSKSANLVMVAYNYEKQGKNVMVLKPEIDTRSENDFVESRVGVKTKCTTVSKEQDLSEVVQEYLKEDMLHCLLVDEAQFLTEAQVVSLTKVTDELGVPVICYGLKNSAIPGALFEGSTALLYYSDSIEEIKHVCTFCNRKAIMNLRVVDGKAIYAGDVIKVGDTDDTASEFYYPTCRKHFFDPLI